MATKAPRPGVQRKKDEIDEATRAQLSVAYGDELHVVYPTEMSAIDALELRKQTGLRIADLLFNMTDNDKRDISDMAAVIWLSRRSQGERDLTFDEVAADVTLDALIAGQETHNARVTKPGDDAAGEA